jgi:uncharacterized membrane protein
MLLPLVTCAALLCWRDSSWLAALNGVGLLASAGLCAASIPGFRLRSAGLGAVARIWGSFAGALAAGMLVVVTEHVMWREVRARSRLHRLEAPLRGLAVAVPLVVVFGGLFVAADAVFGELVGTLLGDVRDPTPHVVAIFGFG